MKITFRQIDAFRTVISTGSVTEAATLLGVSQPAISRLLADFETELGFALFHRQGRILIPTEEARLLVHEVRQAVSGMEHIKHAAEAIGTYGHSTLRLVTAPVFSSVMMPDMIAKFAKAFPNVALSLEIEANDDTAAWLVSHSHDFGLSTSEAGDPTLTHHVLTEQHALAVVPEGHRLAAQAQIRPEYMRGESFVSYARGSRFRHAIDAVFDGQGIVRNCLYETRTTQSICHLVARGLGVSVVAATEAQLRGDAGCVIRTFDAPLTFRAVLTWSKARPLSAPAQGFLDLARERAGALE